MSATERLGVYCIRCGWFSLRAAGERCGGCGSRDDLIERRGLTCPACHRPTPSDDLNYRRCLECESVLPEIS